jgi:hypothetical protein
MPTVLRQRRFFVTKIFEITDKSLKVKTSSILNSTELNLSFERITKDLIHKRFVSKVMAFFCMLFLMLTLREFIDTFYSIKRYAPLDYLAMYFLALIVTFSVALYKKTEITYLNLSNGRRIKIYSSKPSKIDVDNFLESLYQERKSYLSTMNNHN